MSNPGLILPIHNREIERRVGAARFRSETLRLYKLPELEERCEDHGQVATYRGKIQPIHPFAPHQVTTIGALEMIGFVQQLESGDEGLLIIDSRTRDWARRGTLAGSINIAFTEFKDEERALEIMEEWFDVLNTGLSLDFSNAKPLVLFCNGIWCGQSPTTIRTLLRMGYPAAKIHYFRGGMQNWQSLGLTVVSP